MVEVSEKRLAALEAVAEAARKWLCVVAALPYQNQGELDAMDACEKALFALDALPASPPGEMVEFSAWEHEDGMIAWYRTGSRHDLIEMSGWTRLGTVRLPLAKEAGDAG